MVPDRVTHEQKGGEKPLQIGLLQQRLSRVVENLVDIQVALQRALPSANVTFSYLDSPQIDDQAAWFATKDVIIACHGAALTNPVFITKGTFVLQLYPPGFHWQSLDPIIEQSGGIALDSGEGVDPIGQYYENKKDSRKKNKAQHLSFSPPIEQVVDTVLSCPGIQRANTSNMVISTQAITISTGNFNSSFVSITLQLLISILSILHPKGETSITPHMHAGSDLISHTQTSKLIDRDNRHV